MLIELKNKHHKLATMMSSVFVGGWLLLLCQTCFASNDNQMIDQQTDEMTMPCHDSTSADSNSKECFGPCDCDELNVVINSDSNFGNNEKVKYSQDVFVSFEHKIKLSNRSPPSKRISSPPARAILLPLEFFNVLLI
jgi:hypothetical protein